MKSIPPSKGGARGMYHKSKFSNQQILMLTTNIRMTPLMSYARNLQHKIYFVSFLSYRGQLNIQFKF